jgi:predicted ArsR family transcriptional regulator
MTTKLDKDVRKLYIRVVQPNGSIQKARDPKILRADVIMLLKKHGPVTRTRVTLMLGAHRKLTFPVFDELEAAGKIESFSAVNPLRGRRDEFMRLRGYRPAVKSGVFRGAETLAAFQTAARVAYGVAM